MLIGFAVAIVGYALVYSGVSSINPCITPSGQPVGVLDALIPGRQPQTPPTGGAGGGGTHAGAR